MYLLGVLLLVFQAGSFELVAKVDVIMEGILGNETIPTIIYVSNDTISITDWGNSGFDNTFVLVNGIVVSRFKINDLFGDFINQFTMKNNELYLKNNNEVKQIYLFQGKVSVKLNECKTLSIDSTNLSNLKWNIDRYDQLAWDFDGYICKQINFLGIDTTILFTDVFGYTTYPYVTEEYIYFPVQEERYLNIFRIKLINLPDNLNIKFKPVEFVE